MEKHTDDLKEVESGDRVKFTTTTGRSLDADCVDIEKQNADPRTGEIRTTTIWEFQMQGVSGAVTLFASIVDGLRSSPDDSEFPQYNAVWNASAEENLGYIEQITILK